MWESQGPCFSSSWNNHTDSFAIKTSDYYNWLKTWSQKIIISPKIKHPLHIHEAKYVHMILVKWCMYEMWNSCSFLCTYHDHFDCNADTKTNAGSLQNTKVPTLHAEPDVSFSFHKIVLKAPVWRFHTVIAWDLSFKVWDWDIYFRVSNI